MLQVTSFEPDKKKRGRREPFYEVLAHRLAELEVSPEQTTLVSASTMPSLPADAESNVHPEDAHTQICVCEGHASPMRPNAKARNEWPACACRRRARCR